MATIAEFQELRQAEIEFWEKIGRLDPKCESCRVAIYDSINTMPQDVMYPSHVASFGCESGKRPHCTCDACW